MIKVALTGANGYIGSYICAELLRRGNYIVHAPVRESSKKKGKIEHLLKLRGAAERLKVFEGGDLTAQGSFDEAFEGCEAVVHTAAKVELGLDPEIISASVDGVKNVLKSIDAAKTVTRVVHTSSIAAIQRYDKPANYIFSEMDWNDWSLPTTDAYGFAKTEAERCVAEHCESREIRYVALNPSIVIGPVMIKQHSKASAIFLRDVIFGNKVLNVPSNFVDVRDVAEAHVEALERIDTIDGPRRFILSCDTGVIQATELADIANRCLPQFIFHAPPMYDPNRMKFIYIPLSRIPFFGSYIMSEFHRRAFSTPIRFDTTYSKRVLGLSYRPMDDTVRDGVLSMIDAGFAKAKERAA